MTSKFLILGAGGFAKEVASLIKHNWPERFLFEPRIDMSAEPQYAKAGVVSLDPDREEKLDYDHIYLGVGNPQLKEKLKDLASYIGGSFTYRDLVSSDLIHNKHTVCIGVGTIICQRCVITTDVVIKEFVTINIGCMIGHDVRIGRFSTIAPSCNLMGGVIIEDYCELGAAVTVIPDVRIGHHSVIGAGAVVTKDIPPYSVAVGIPAKVIKDVRESSSNSNS